MECRLGRVLSSEVAGWRSSRIKVSTLDEAEEFEGSTLDIAAEVEESTPHVVVELKNPR